MKRSKTSTNNQDAIDHFLGYRCDKTSGCVRGTMENRGSMRLRECEETCTSMNDDILGHIGDFLGANGDDLKVNRKLNKVMKNNYQISTDMNKTISYLIDQSQDPEEELEVIVDWVRKANKLRSKMLKKHGKENLIRLPISMDEDVVYCTLQPNDWQNIAEHQLNSLPGTVVQCYPKCPLITYFIRVAYNKFESGDPDIPLISMMAVSESIRSLQQEAYNYMDDFNFHELDAFTP